MGHVTTGVRRDLRLTGNAEPRTALESVALALATQIDDRPDDKTLAALSRELRLTLAQIASDAPPGEDNELDRISGERESRRKP